MVFQAAMEANVKVTNDDLKTAWKTFHPEVEAQIIKLSSEDEAKEVKKSADDGTDFTKLAKEKLENVNAKILGAILNKYESKNADYGYYYGEYYGQKKKKRIWKKKKLSNKKRKRKNI